MVLIPDEIYDEAVNAGYDCHVLLTRALEWLPGGKGVECSERDQLAAEIRDYLPQLLKVLDVLELQGDA